MRSEDYNRARADHTPLTAPLLINQRPSDLKARPLTQNAADADAFAPDPDDHPDTHVSPAELSAALSGIRFIAAVRAARTRYRDRDTTDPVMAAAMTPISYLPHASRAGSISDSDHAQGPWNRAPGFINHVPSPHLDARNRARLTQAHLLGTYPGTPSNPHDPKTWLGMNLYFGVFLLLYVTLSLSPLAWQPTLAISLALSVAPAIATRAHLKTAAAGHNPLLALDDTAVRAAWFDVCRIDDVTTYHAADYPETRDALAEVMPHIRAVLPAIANHSLDADTLDDSRNWFLETAARLRVLATREQELAHCRTDGADMHEALRFIRNDSLHNSGFLARAENINALSRTHDTALDRATDWLDPTNTDHLD